MKNTEKMQRLVKNREAGDRHQPDKQNKWDGNQVGMVEELRHRARLRRTGKEGGVRTTSQDVEWIWERYMTVLVKA